MKHVLQNRWAIFFIGMILSICCTKVRSLKQQYEDKNNKKVNIEFEIDSLSVAFRAVNDQKLNEFYYNEYVKSTWGSSGTTRSIYVDSIIADRGKSIPTLIDYLQSKNDSLRITAYVLLVEATKKYSGNVHIFNNAKDSTAQDSIISLYKVWWKIHK